MSLQAYALKQVNRFDGLKYAPGATGLRELVSALCSCCKSEEHIKAVVDEWRQDQREWPTYADLRRIAMSIMPVFDTSAHPVDCAGCGGSGWVAGYSEYIPFQRNGHCRYHVRNPMEKESDFAARMSHYERETMPEGRVLATSVWRCNCAAGMARQRREDA
jgi:hypothetical protein